MALNYTENRIKEALRLNDGNAALAKKQVFAWLYEDHKLLLDITRPHLNGIVAYALMRTLARLSKTDDEILAEQAEEAGRSASKRHATGKDILKSFAARDALQFGHEYESGRPLERKAASQTHIDTMHMLAAASRKKNTD